jgi:hypothetical protein
MSSTKSSGNRSAASWSDPPSVWERIRQERPLSREMPLEMRQRMRPRTVNGLVSTVTPSGSGGVPPPPPPLLLAVLPPPPLLPPLLLALLLALLLLLLSAEAPPPDAVPGAVRRFLAAGAGCFGLPAAEEAPSCFASRAERRTAGIDSGASDHQARLWIVIQQFHAIFWYFIPRKSALDLQDIDTVRVPQVVAS